MYDVQSTKLHHADIQAIKQGTMQSLKAVRFLMRKPDDNVSLKSRERRRKNYILQRDALETPAERQLTLSVHSHQMKLLPVVGARRVHQTTQNASTPPATLSSSLRLISVLLQCFNPLTPTVATCVQL